MIKAMVIAVIKAMVIAVIKAMIIAMITAMKKDWHNYKNTDWG